MAQGFLINYCNFQKKIDISIKIFIKLQNEYLQSLKFSVNFEIHRFTVMIRSVFTFLPFF